MIIGKVYYFDAAHFLPGHPECGEVHGHTWTVEVQLEGKLNEQGMVLDFGILDTEVRSILKGFDHTLLNNLLDYPTCEILATQIRIALTHSSLIRDSGVKLHSVKVQEGRGGWAMYWEDKSKEKVIDLKVRIPKRFKEDLIQRVTLPEEREATVKMGEYCPLCEEYGRSVGCKGCPFDRFKGEGKLGCFLWMWEVVGSPVFIPLTHGIKWQVEDEEVARERLCLLREKGGKLVEWTE